jgi:DNA-directed RNA polymerase subunit L
MVDLNITNIKKQKYVPLIIEKNNKIKGPHSSHLTLEFKGKDATDIFANTIRRIALDYIPTYAFSSKLIKITKNTSIFNNDMMKLRLSQLPILDTSIDIFSMPRTKCENIENNLNNNDNNDNNDEMNIILHLNIKNNSDVLKNVTTSDMEYYENDKLIKNKYEKTGPILLIQLKPTEEFSCKMKGCLGVGIVNNIWSSVSNVYYDTDENKNLTLTLESQGQFDEYTILLKVCKYINSKLNELIKDITENDKLKTNDDTVELFFENENHTLGAILAYYLQNNKYITFAGYTKKDYMLEGIHIKIKGRSGKLMDDIHSSFNNVKELFVVFEKELKKHNK